MTTPEGLLRLGVGLLLCVTLVTQGCGTRSTRTQSAEHSTIKLTGDLNGVSVQIDGGERFTPESRYYRVSTGTHEIRIYRDDEVVVHRKVFLDDQVTREIHVP